MEHFNLCTLILTVKKLLENQARSKNLQFNFELPTKCNVYADIEKTTKILVNLIGNTIIYTQQGGVKVSVRGKGDMMICEVRDSGPGLNAEEKRIVFLKYKRLGTKDAKGEEIKGTGLGLWICKNYAKMMGGEIGVRSRKNHGSTFWFTLKQEK